MIRSFKCRDTALLASDRAIKRFKAVERVARRRLEMLEAAERLSDLKVPPGNRLEALKGVQRGQYGIRVYNQWRIRFRWDEGAVDVEIVD
jgi:toxin HigB-1